nr:reverse transcriptase domain-containing protein [Tanacetum cinerariifolium]
MSAMANTTPLVTTVTKPATNPRDADATPRVNNQDFCEEYYEDILPIIMDKVRHDKRKEVHVRLDFGKSSRERRTREDSHYSSARARTTKPERLTVQDHLRYGDRHVLNRLGHRRQSAFDQLSDTYSPSTTKSRPRGTDSRDHPRGRSRPQRLDTSNEDCPNDRERFRGVGESYDDSFSHSYRDGNRSRHMKRRRDNESSLSSVSKSDSSDGRYQKSRSKRHKSTDDDDLTRPWMCEEEDPFTPRIRAARVWFDELSPESVESYKDLKAAFLTYFKQQNKYVKDLVEIHNIKQKDGETIEDFMERFKVETKRMKGALNDQSKRQTLEKRSDFRGHPKEGRESNRFTPLTRTPKEILAAKAGKFQSPPPMVTPVEKKSSNRFCDFHNDKGHSTDECMQLKKQIEELVRAGKLSHLIKKIKHGRDQSKTEKKETPSKDKPTEIYMIQSWQIMTRQKVTQSFERVKEITFPPLTASSGVEGPLVIEAEMDGHMIHRMYVDGGSSMEILYEHCFNRLRPEIKSQMVPATTSLTGFSGETIWPLGQLRLLATIGDVDHSTRAYMNFMIVRSLSPYNGIIGRPGIREIQAVPSTAQGMLKFLVEGGIVTIRSTILIHVECTSVITSSTVSKEEEIRPENFKVALHPDFPDQEVAIGGTLSAKRRTELCSILKKNLDIFAWKLSDMTGVPRSVAEHRLNIREGYSPVRKRKGARPLNVLRPYKQRFLYKSAEKSLPLFKTLKKCIKKSDFHWTVEAEQAFKQLKQHLSELFLLVAPKPNEELIIYLSATYGAISAILMIERGATQTPIYFISRALQGPKLYYTPMEKLVRSLVFAAKRLRSVMLGEHNITYRPRTSVKGQILADFLTEMPDENPPAAPVAETQQEPWTPFTDGSSCVDVFSAGLILTNPEGIEFTYALRFQFAASNNEAEYEALIDGLRRAVQMGVQKVHVSIDSKLVANQVLGTYVAKEENMIKYLDKVKSLVSGFTNFSISQLPRSKNKKADALSKIASTSFAHLSKQVLVEILKDKSIKEKEVTTMVEEDGPTWMTQIVEYLKEGTLPSDRKEARKLRIKARQYELLEGILYRRSFLTSWLRCVGPL